MLCKSCKGSKFIDGVDLGLMPVAELISKQKEDKTKFLKTNMVICSNCYLGQLTVDVLREDIFTDYTFKTSESASFIEHAKEYANFAINKYGITKNDWVLEIASNDGYLLKIFKEKGINAIGVDPAKNIAMYAICDGLPTIVDFFGTSVAKEILRVKGHPKLIIANNVLAHVPNINDFMQGISILCNEDTVVSIENPSILNILNKNQFDTIYHGHYSYLSCNSVYRLANRFGLDLFDFQEVPVHGVSNRYWLSKTKQRKQIVTDIIDYEIKSGILNPEAWAKYRNSLNFKITMFKSHLESLNRKGAKVFGYAASSKCTTLLNYAKINPDWIISVADDMKEKQGGFIPGLNIPIVSLEEIMSQDPTDIIVFSWNIYDELKKKVEKMSQNKINIWRW